MKSQLNLNLLCCRVSTGTRQCNFLDQMENLAMGQDRLGQPAKIQDRMRNGTITSFLSKSETGLGIRRRNHYFFPEN